MILDYILTEPYLYIYFKICFCNILQITIQSGNTAAVQTQQSKPLAIKSSDNLQALTHSTQHWFTRKRKRWAELRKSNWTKPWIPTSTPSMKPYRFDIYNQFHSHPFTYISIYGFGFCFGFGGSLCGLISCGFVLCCVAIVWTNNKLCI